MKSQIKFTNDGKKVVVVGSLNSQETIVQEIFIINGNEIPSGENFVVKSLHDSPAISWKEKSLKELEERYEKDRSKYQDLIDADYKNYRQKSEELKLKISYLGGALKNANEESFNLLTDFICGNITHIVKIQYSRPELIEFSEFRMLYEGKLRLFSIFGKDDGSFTYAVGQYYDFSGGSEIFHPFKSYESAFKFFKDYLQSLPISKEIVEIAQKYDIELCAKKVSVYKESQIKIFNNNIEAAENNIKKYRDEIEKIAIG